MAEFFHMGGYAFFVWTSYAIVGVAFTYAFLAPITHHRRLLKEFARTTPSIRRSKVTATQSSASSAAKD